MRDEPGLLGLEDGAIFRGIAVGAPGTSTGEVCFNTGMTGYQEVLTDPSYHGQIVAMTAPHVGNTGVNLHDEQASRPWVAGFVVRDLCTSPSSWRASGSLPDLLERHGIACLSEIDTRRLTRHIRSRGAMRAALSSTITDPDELVDVARAAPPYETRELVSEVTTAVPYRWSLEEVERRAEHGYAAGSERAPATRALLETGDPRAARRVAAFDFGVKTNLLDLLVAGGCEVTVVPARTPAEEVLDGGFDGVFLSNGPGDPSTIDYAAETASSLLGRIPIFGICLGHQVLARALGATTIKLPFGHRGGNHPVARVDAPGIEITCQNHGFAVEPDSIAGTPARLTHVNLNDGTVEGLAVEGVAFGVQYHPEAGPGPHDSRYLFERFRHLMLTFEPSAMVAT
ncbi:MAG: glutamine-hydrolyzing carbamoyl-phosphate synthase small subunit [Actinomycetota bacterium]